MRAFLLLGVAATLLVVAAQAQDAKDEKVEKELKRLEGSWILVSGEVDGKEVAKEHLQQSKLTHAGKDVAVEVPHLFKEPVKNKVARVDPTKTPKEVDFVRVAGPLAGKTILAIYELGEDDSFKKICLDLSGKERPREFKTKPGSGHVLHVWKRAKK
jgi:uncharacterized protein (TIGR03067 family)